MDETSEFDIVNINIILKSGSPETDIHVNTIKNFIPDSGDLERCRRYLISRGVTCHPTSFGLACSAPKEVIEKVFKTKLKTNENESISSMRQFLIKPEIPVEIEKYVEQITLEIPPELF